MDEMASFEAEDDPSPELTEELEHNLELLRAMCAKQCMKLNVKTLTGKTITLKVLIKSSVACIKELILNYEGILPESQRLSFEGKVLEDHQKMHTKRKHTNNDKQQQQQQLLGWQHPEPLQHPERVHSAAGPR
jgi:hypothetical protein